MGAAGEDQVLLAFRGVGLDDAHAREALAESAGDLGVDPAALPEEGAQTTEGEGHGAAEEEQDADGVDRERPVHVEQEAERERRGHDAAGELHQSGADQVPYPFRVGHDARDEHPGLGGIEVVDGKTGDVGLHRLAHLRDGPLGRDAQDLRERERGAALKERRHGDPEGKGDEEVAAPLPEHVVDEELGRGRDRHARDAADRHDDEPERHPTAVAPDDLARFAPHVGALELDPLLVRHRFSRAGSLFPLRLRRESWRLPGRSARPKDSYQVRGGDGTFQTPIRRSISST